MILPRPSTKFWLWALAVVVNLGAVFLFVRQVQNQRGAYLQLRSENGFLFLESLSQAIVRVQKHPTPGDGVPLDELADYLAAFEKSTHLKHRHWEVITSLHHLEVASVLDENGRLQYGSELPMKSVPAELEPVLRGTQASRSLTKIWEGTTYHLYAHSLTQGGALVLGRKQPVGLNQGLVDTFNYLMEFEELAYLIFEDMETQHYIAQVWEGAAVPPRLAQDPRLKEAVFTNQPFVRELEIEGQRILACNWPVFAENRFLGLLRVGLTLDYVSLLQRDFAFHMAVILVFILTANGYLIYALVLEHRLGRTGVRLRRILEKVADGVLVCDKGRDILVNPQFTKLCGPQWRSWIKNLREPMTKRAVGGRHILILRNEFGFGTFFIARDVTVEDIAEQTRDRERRMLSAGQLSSTFAHEIRNPLNTISLLVQSLDFSSSKRGKAQQMISDEIRRLDQIVQEFIQVTKMPVLQREVITSGAFFDEIAGFYASRARAMGFRLRVENQSRGQSLYWDPSKVKGVWINLIENSLQAGANELVLRINWEKPFVHITLEDNGKGMDRETAEKAFALYFTTRDEGSGLGLPFVQRVVTAHNGFLRLDSSPGRGCRVEVFLPQGREAS